MHTSHPHNAAEYDFDCAVKPTKVYVICTTGRSGSTYLASLLWQTGVCGAPQEYFNYNTIMFQLAQRMGTRNIQEYAEALFRHRTSPNGVFGMKTHLNQFNFFHRFSGVSSLFQPLHYIYIEREDLLAQAVSYAIARETNQWMHLLDVVKEPVYERRLITQCLRSIEGQKANWRRLFRELRVEPHTVTYESLLKTPEAAVNGILRFLGIERPDETRPVKAPPLERQSDPRKAEWVARYREEAHQRPVG